MSSIYLIGSLRNPAIPAIGQRLREVGWDVFDDWFAGGPEADDKWKEYEQARGHSYTEALEGYAAGHVYWFDREHLDRCDAALLVSPAGRSAHLELGYMAGKGRKTYILLEPDTDPRWDVMMKFATKVFSNQEEMIACLDMRKSLTVQMGLTGAEKRLGCLPEPKSCPSGRCDSDREMEDPNFSSPPNPKDWVGSNKAPMSIVPPRVLLEVGLGMAEGALKYGAYNYREAGIRASTYYDGLMRHMLAWWESEDLDPDSKLSHVTKAITDLVVLRDGMLEGNWIDDRPPAQPNVGDYMAPYNEAMAALRAKYPNEAKPFTQMGRYDKQLDKALAVVRTFDQSRAEQMDPTS